MCAGQPYNLDPDSMYLERPKDVLCEGCDLIATCSGVGIRRRSSETICGSMARWWCFGYDTYASAGGGHVVECGECGECGGGGPVEDGGVAWWRIVEWQ